MNTSRKFTWCIGVLSCISLIVAIIVACLTYIGIGYAVIVLANSFTPQCSGIMGRICNGRGVCVGGRCECNILYSGPSCSDQLIPGYSLGTNQECNGNGVGWPFLEVPQVCIEERNGSIILGKGWSAPGCVQFVNRIRGNLITNQNDPFITTNVTNIPTCVCFPGFGGVDCSKSTCPTDENGYICGQNGDSSVGLFFNRSGIDGDGCQCTSLAQFTVPPLLTYLTPQQQKLIRTTYYHDFNRIFCSAPELLTLNGYVALNTTTDPAQLVPDTGDYRCYCDVGWKGTTCTENQCPQSVLSNQICNGHGSPYFGQGRLLNTTKNVNKGKNCQLLCKDGFQVCSSSQCVKTLPPTFPLFDQSQICASIPQAIQPNPLRCFDGKTTSIPTDQKGCTLGYRVGVIDPTQISSILNPCIITDDLTFTDCFNTGLPIGYRERGGFYWNSSIPLSIQTTSPLVYYQISTNITGTAVATSFTSQSISTGPLYSGSFIYTERSGWILQSTPGINFTVTNGLICPFSSLFNYTGSVLFPINFTQVRLSQEVGGLSYVFEISSSLPILSSQLTKSYLLVRFSETLWHFPPTGSIVTNQVCLSEPSRCSWIIWNNEVRSLDSRFFVCEQAGAPIIKAVGGVGCVYSLFTTSMKTFLYNWDTCLEGETLFPTSVVETTVFTVLETNFSLPLTYTSTFQFPPTGEIIEVLSPAFLTLDNIHFPCSCDPLSAFGISNWTTLNQQWWDETEIRATFIDEIEIGDYVLYRRVERGEPIYYRMRIMGIGEDQNNTLLLWNPQFDKNYSAFVQDTRRININEVLLGSPDGDQLLYPFRCPDGQISAASTSIRELPVSCNCTYLQPRMQCTCRDPTQANWTCACLTNEQYCQCDLPALPDFENKLMEKVNGLVGTDCQCLIFNPINQTNTSITTTPDFITTRVNFRIGLEQFPQFVVVKTTGLDCNNSQFELVGLSTLFLNRSIPFYYQNGSVVNCEHWLTLIYPAEYAIQDILLISTDVIQWASIRFSVIGYSLTGLEFLGRPAATFRASSNEINSALVNTLNSSYWVSNNSEIPVFIEVDLHAHYYVQYMSIIFYQSGVLIGNTTLPFRIFVQGWTIDSWYTIGSVGVYVEEGGWAERSLVFNLTQQFSKFRLITLEGVFGVRSWGIYSNQACSCLDGNFLTLNLASLDGLPTVQSVLDELESYNTNLLGDGCVYVNNCTIKISPNTIANFSNDGICQDAINLAFLTGFTPTPVLINSTVFDNSILLNSTNVYKLYTWDLLPGVDTIQFAISTSLFLNRSEQLAFFTIGSVQLNSPNFPPEPSEENATYALNQTIYYLNQSTLITISTQDPRGDPYSQSIYVNGTFITLSNVYSVDYGDVIEKNMACCAGCDAADCGSSIRNKPIQTGVFCAYSPQQAQLLTLIQNTTILVNQTFYVNNLTLLSDWNASYENVPLTRTEPITTLINCPEQVCLLPTPYRCPNGDCVEYMKDCKLRFDCPGNGCVEQTDASSFGNSVFRCACDVGYAGDACQFGACLPATPFLSPGEYGATPGALECSCGQLPPLRLKPPIVNQGRFLNERIVSELNMADRADSTKKSDDDINYNLVMPGWNWGAVLRYVFNLATSSTDVLAAEAQQIETTCTPARLGFYNDLNLLVDDVEERNPITGKVEKWRRYQDPYIANRSYEYRWLDITKWAQHTFINGTELNTIQIFRNQVPYRCPNGVCVKDQSFCQRAQQLYPLCNGLGECRADGYCKCFAGSRSFTVNEEFSQQMRYPYPTNLGVPNPTSWLMNWNWKHFGLIWCSARDCTEADCSVPVGCFPGTPSIQFQDALVPCESPTGVNRRCAPSLEDCVAKKNLQYPKICSGNGIARQKDFTGEYYCACGTPISALANITSITQIIDLKPNGWGGPRCDQYEATGIPIVYSTWNFQLDLPYRSTVTNQQLPGIWPPGYGPDPDQRIEWQNYCFEFTRLELCPWSVCKQKGSLKKILATDCIVPSTPQIFPCNNHGILRADGTCLCDYDEQTGVGYTSDFTQFSTPNCYRRYECPKSLINGKSCHYLDACTASEFRLPAPNETYLAQQTYMCSTREGLINNATILNQISTSVDVFRDRLIQGLTTIALEVERDITGSQSCICVYPDDTQFVKTGMVPGGNYEYFENYIAPYYLDGNVLSYPFLMDRSLEQAGWESYIISPGATIQFVMKNPINTTMSAFRAYGNSSSVGQFSFTSGGQQICTPTTTPPNQQLFVGGLDWVQFKDGVTASYCGPFYKCSSDFDEPDQFQFYCGSSITNQACIDWLNLQCFSNPSLYIRWPIDSAAVYTGCSRSDGIFGTQCTCCKIISNSPFPQITDGVINITYTGTQPIQLGQIQIYGYGDEALVLPDVTEKYIQQQISTDNIVQCQDYAALSTYLGANLNYWNPNNNYTVTGRQDPQTWDISTGICNQSASYIANPQSTLSTTNIAGNVNVLQVECSRLVPGNANAKCWVGNKDAKFNELYDGRQQLLNNNCETCYDEALTNGFRTLSFSTYPNIPADSNDYKIPMFPTQFPTFDVFKDTAKDLSFSATIYSPLYPDSIATSCEVKITYKFRTQGEAYKYDALTFTLLFTQVNFPIANTITATVFSTFRNDAPPSSTTRIGIAKIAFGTTLTSNILCEPFGDTALLTVGVDKPTCLQLMFRGTDLTGNDGIAVFWMQSSIPQGCSVINLYDKQTCNNAGFKSSITNTQSGNSQFPVFGYAPYYIIDGNCQLAYGDTQWIAPPIPSLKTKFLQCPDYVRGTSTTLESTYNLFNVETRGCFKIFPNFDFYQLKFTRTKSAFSGQSTGFFGDNYIPTIAEFHYLPGFIKLEITLTISPITGRVFRIGDIIHNDDVPVYFTSNPISQNFGNIFDTFFEAPVKKCRECYKKLIGNFIWYDYIYLSNKQWFNTLAINPTANNEVNVFIYVAPKSPLTGTTTILAPPGVLTNGELTTLTTAQFVHLTTYIQSRKNSIDSIRKFTDRWTWHLTSCLAVTPSGFQPRICQENLNFICQWNYLPYTVQSGFQCPTCGPADRPGGRPIPGQTCFDIYPFSNATLYPEQHLYYENYIKKTLYLIADTISPPSVFQLEEGVNVVWGIVEGWQAWKNSYSSRGVEDGGRPSVGAIVDQNWCDQCLSCNWPIDCQKAGYPFRNPITNVIERTCATNEEFCNLNEPNTVAEPLIQLYIPPLFSPVSPELATVDKTCGYPVFLWSFALMDKWGAPQSDLKLNSTLLRGENTFIELQVVNPIAFWYNGGKTTTGNYRFNWNFTTTVTFSYYLQSCPGCPTNPKIKVIIYPLTVGYSFPIRVLFQQVSLIVGSLQTVSVSFQPTPTDTGITTINGETFPLFPYQGVGFNLSELTKGSVITLYNPILIDPNTILECTTRTVPQLVGPTSRIISTVPYRPCITTEEIQLDFPGKNIGECGCDLSSAGRTCDCLSGLSKYGSGLPCRGFGEGGVKALSPQDGQFYQTGEGEDEGCFVNSLKIAECKVLDVGVALFTLMTEGAIWNYPSVLVDSPPANGQPIFIVLSNHSEVDWFGAQEECILNANRLVYYFTADELTQLVSISTPPFFISTALTNNYTIVPWISPVSGTYFINGQTPGSATQIGDYNCAVDFDLCKAMNFNNWLFNSTLVCLADGNTITTCSSPGLLSYSSLAPLEVDVVVFGTSVSITCPGGFCQNIQCLTQTCYFKCRCPLRQIILTGIASEVQVFSDLIRTTLYKYI